MNENYLVVTVVNLITIFIELTLLGVFIYYVVKRQSLDGILLLISSILTIAIRPIIYFGYNYLNNDALNMEPQLIFTTVIQICYLLNSLLFTIGIVMLIVRVLKEQMVGNTHK